MQKKWVLASTNLGKIEEIRSILAPFNIHLYAQNELNCPEIEETGLTFEENAIIKARHAALITGLPALSDDSGLSIDVLQGQPGIYSARFAGPARNSEANLEKVLRLMQNCPPAQRTARFHCALAFISNPHHLDQVICFHGSWEGFILEKKEGSGGFGYDPIFFDPLYRCSAASLSQEDKAKQSHRGQALDAFITYLNFSS